MELVYKEITGTQDERPKDIDITSSSTDVYVRKDIEQITNKDESGNERKEWHYKEAVLTKEEYESLAPFLSIEAKQDSSANNIGILMDAVADLYEQMLSVNA